MDIWLNFGVSAVLTALQNLKGEKKKAQLKRVFLKIYKAIQTAYAGDEDFS